MLGAGRGVRESLQSASFNWGSGVIPGMSCLALGRSCESPAAVPPSPGMTAEGCLHAGELLRGSLGIPKEVRVCKFERLACTWEIIWWQKEQDQMPCRSQAAGRFE